MTRLEQQLNFINEIEKLKTVTRMNKTLDGRQENSAEHSWHLGIIGMYLAEYGEVTLDKFKVVQLLLIHDLVEIYAGDAFLYNDKARKAAEKKEEASLKQLVALLPEDQGNELYTLWHEFEDKKTPEAQFAKAIDAFQPLLNHYLTAEDDFNPSQITLSQVYDKKGFIKDYCPKLWPAVEEIIQKNLKKGLFIDDLSQDNC